MSETVKPEDARPWHGAADPFESMYQWVLTTFAKQGTVPAAPATPVPLPQAEIDAAVQAAAQAEFARVQAAMAAQVVAPAPVCAAPPVMAPVAEAPVVGQPIAQ